jgi:hypothetical protein
MPPREAMINRKSKARRVSSSRASVVKKRNGGEKSFTRSSDVGLAFC